METNILLLETTMSRVGKDIQSTLAGMLAEIGDNEKYMMSLGNQADMDEVQDDIDELYVNMYEFEARNPH